MKRFYPFLRIFLIPPFGEIVVIITQIGKTLIDLTNLFKLNLLLSSYLFVYYSSYSYSVFNDHNIEMLKHFYFYDFLSEVWWAQVDSNHRPRAYQARALTT